MADKKFAEEAVKAHNEYRKRHQAAPLSHAKDLSAQAQKWADHLAATGSLQHSNATLKGETLGENIAMKWSSSPQAYSGQEVTDQWYSEVKDHVFGREPSTLNTGHFTQVVWKGSGEVGLGKAVTGDGKVMVVANYRPAGNVTGSFTANVLPPLDGKITLPVNPAAGGRASPSSNVRGFPSSTTPTNTGSPEAGVSFPASRTESKSVRTFTVTEGVGPNKVTKTVTEETIIKANGEKVVRRNEVTTRGGSAPSSDSSNIQGDFGRLTLSGFGGDRADSSQPGRSFWQPRNDFSPDPAGRGTSTGRGGSDGKPIPQNMSDFQKDCLQAHNAKRSLHSAPPLSLASDLTNHAQKWADHLTTLNSLQHSECMVQGKRVGENVACQWSSAGADYTGEQVVDQWYSEIKKHNFGSNSAPNSGHFTQVVWKGSQELGVGKAKDGKGKCIVVCNYRPAGNMMGAYRENVSPPS